MARPDRDLTTHRPEVGAHRRSEGPRPPIPEEHAIRGPDEWERSLQSRSEPRLARPDASVARRIAGRLHTIAIRHRITRWAAAVAAGLLAASGIGRALAGVESARADWGQSVDVVVTSRALATGDPVTPGSVEVVAAPAHLVTPDTVTELPLGSRVTADVGPGEILVGRRLTSGRGSPSSIVLPAGTRGVQLPRAEVLGGTGDVVDLHALINGAHLAQAVVVRSDESTVTVAVPTADVAAVVDAISQGGLISVLVP